jgi:hypothetical protein
LAQNKRKKKLQLKKILDAVKKYVGDDYYFLKKEKIIYTQREAEQLTSNLHILLIINLLYLEFQILGLRSTCLK